MHAFPPAARLHRPSEFAPALKGQRIARGDLLVLTVPRPVPSVASTAAETVSPSPDNALTGDGTQPAPAPAERARLGMVIAKRHAKRAVVRNTIKRVLREAFRHQQAQLPARDYVFRLQSRVEPQSLTQLKQQVRLEADALLRKARRR